MTESLPALLRHTGLLLLALSVSLSSAPAVADKVYKYQDAQGRWHFGDKKPAAANFEEVTTRQAPKQKPDVVMIVDRNRLFAENRLYAPVLLQIVFEGQAKPAAAQLKAREQRLVHTAEGSSTPKFTYRYRVGDPSAKPDGAALASPFAGFHPQKITQGFNGRFSHQHEGSRYAIDVALPVGTHIVAARGGVVVLTQGKFVIGGVSSKYFIDKANAVTILHDDGSFASYAHLLPDSIVVKPGDRVGAGDLLARSGSSGFSSGPHLHFVVLRAGETQLVSIPFHLRDSAGNERTPQAGHMLEPARRPD